MNALQRITATAATMAIAAVSVTAQNEDYLSPELRARVELLKAEAAEAPASRDRLAWRHKTLWQWGNAYAMTGGPVPVDFPTTIARNLHAVYGSSIAAVAEADDRIVEVFEKFVREFTLKEEHPNAFGKLRIEDAGPFIAGSDQAIVQTFTIEDVPMRPGGGLVIKPRLPGIALIPSSGDEPPVIVTTSRAGARLEETRPWAQTRGMMYLRQPTLHFQLRGEALVKGDTITIRFGSESSPFTMQTQSNDRVITPIYVDFDGSGILITPDWPSFEVVGQPQAASVSAIAPSIVGIDEPFDVAVRTEDTFKNVISGTAPSYTITRGDRTLAEVPAGGAGVHVMRGQSIQEPGIYRYKIVMGDLTCESNPIWVKRDVDRRVFWGDTHGHTGFAEGQGTPGGYYAFARNVARLDFLSLSEHDIWMDDWEWKQLAEMTRKHAVPGEFTPILGYEWTAKSPVGGHHNVFFRTTENRTRVPMQETFDLANLYAGLNALYDPEEVLVIPHAHQAGDWTRSDPGIERLTEITSSHGTFEFFGDNYLRNGYEVGFIGSSDNHEGHPGWTGAQGRQAGGLAAVWATENSINPIFDALRDRHTYATTGERIILDVTLNDGEMGQRLPDAKRRTLKGTVAGTAPIDRIDIVKNGETLHSIRYQGKHVDSLDSVQVLFESSSHTQGHFNPRGVRPWSGEIIVEGAKLAAVRGADFFQPGRDRFIQDFENPNRVVFSTTTRGRGKGIMLRLENATADTVVTLRTRAAQEGPPSPGNDEREQLPLDPMTLSVRLGQLENGPVREEQTVVHNVDAISMQLAAENDGLDRAFEYTDNEDTQPGDYYYVRVQQIDGAMAWSSPIWVGGTSAKDRPIATRNTTAITSDHEYISWREHIIDDRASADIDISGSDGLVMADLDADGYEDIVSVHEADTTYDGEERGLIRIAFGTGDPDTWNNVTLADGPEAAAAEDAAIGDVNGDGHPDIIAACELAHLIYFQNPGVQAQSKPWERLIIPITKDRGSFIRVFLADLDGDGQLEAVSPNKGEQNPTEEMPKKPISIFYLEGDPLDGVAWREHVLGTYGIPQNSRPVDLDGDGDLDIVGGSRGESRIMWFENLGGAAFNFTEHRIELDRGAAGGFNMAFHDLNEDGRLDIICATSLGLGWLEQPAEKDGEWTNHYMGTFGPDLLVGLDMADINGDGRPDFMAGSYSRGPRDRDGDLTRDDLLGRIAWFEHPGDPRLPWPRHDISRRVRGMFDKFVARDMDGDGDMDFAGTRGNSDPYDGVFWIEQVRTASPAQNFTAARASDSKEMPSH